MKHRILILLFLVALLVVLSYEIHSISVDEKQVNTNSTENETNSSSMNQSTVIPLERPPFLDDLKEEET